MSEPGQTPAGQPADGRLEELFRSHHAAVVGYARRRAPADSVEDVVAETFLVAWRRLGEVPADEPLPWLLGVARNVIATQRRGVGRRRALSLGLGSRMAESEGRSGEPDGSLLAEQNGSVSAALGRLAAKDREALRLIAWEGLAPSEAAAVLGDSPGAFRVRLHRARGRLRRALEDPRELGLPPIRSPLPKERTNE